MKKTVLYILLSFISLVSYSQGNKIHFIKEKSTYVVKLSCKMGDNEQKNALKKDLLSNLSISSVTFTPLDNSLIKIVCTNNNIEPFLLERLKTNGVESFKNIQK